MNITENRPWGSYTVLYNDSTCQVKKITIAPEQAPSYQYHFKRKELWYVIQGKGQLRLDDKYTDVNEGCTINVDFEQKHQIKNTGNIDLVFIEIQTGTYFGEDDIVRLEDKYGRL